MPEHTPAPTPSRSLYGFLMYLFSKIILAIYCIWAVCPDKYLHFLNIYYYPQKYWATVVPIQCLIALTIFAFLVYPSSNLMLTTSIDNVKTINDTFNQPNCGFILMNNETLTNFCICKLDVSKCMKQNYLATLSELSENFVPELQEFDIRFISRQLYLCRKK